MNVRSGEARLQDQSPEKEAARAAPRGAPRQAHRVSGGTVGPHSTGHHMAKEAAALASAARALSQGGPAPTLSSYSGSSSIASAGQAAAAAAPALPNDAHSNVSGNGVPLNGVGGVGGFPESGSQEEVEQWLKDLGMSEDTLGWARSALPALFDITVPQQNSGPLEPIRPAQERPQSPPGVRPFFETDSSAVGCSEGNGARRFKTLSPQDLSEHGGLNDAQLASDISQRVLDSTQPCTSSSSSQGSNGASLAAPAAVVGGRGSAGGSAEDEASSARTSFLRMNQRTRQQQRRRFRPSPQAGQVMAYLYSLGLNDDNLYWVQLLVPELFELNVESELKPSWRRLFDLQCAPVSVFQQLRCVVVWEFLASLGMRHEDIHVIATSCPSIFTSSLGEGVEPITLLLNDELGIPKIEIGRMFATTPELFFLDIDARIEPVLRSLRARVPEEFVGRIVHSYPGILALSPEEVSTHVVTRMEWLLHMRVDREYVITLLGRRPSAFTSPLNDATASRSIMEELGFTKEQMDQYLPKLLDMAQTS